MKKFKIQIKPKNIILTILAITIILIIALTIIYYNGRNKENSLFRIREILLFNSATVISDPNKDSLENLIISQYSDLSIYIDNNLIDSELTNTNTIKELYIDNISITPKINKGSQTLNYKNPLTIGKYTNITQPNNNRIDFNIINTNEQDDNSNYDEPSFYTDCSNPITLGYLNNNIVNNYSITDDINTVSYNAKV